MRHIDIDMDVNLTVGGIYIEEVEAITYPVDDAIPGTPSDFEVLNIMYEGVNVLPIFERFDEVDEVINLVIKKIEEL